MRYISINVSQKNLINPTFFSTRPSFPSPEENTRTLAHTFFLYFFPSFLPLLVAHALSHSSQSVASQQHQPSSYHTVVTSTPPFLTFVLFSETHTHTLLWCSSSPSSIHPLPYPTSTTAMPSRATSRLIGSPQHLNLILPFDLEDLFGWEGKNLNHVNFIVIVLLINFMMGYNSKIGKENH